MRIKKKGFTLMELLAAILVLAVVVIIAVPIVLDVVDDARKEADMQTAYNLIESAELYYTESMLDENKKADILSNKNLYKDVTLSSDVPKEGSLYVAEDGKVAMSVVLNGTCYKKEYYSDLEVIKDENCTLGYTGGMDDTAPTLTFTLSDEAKANGWYVTDLFVNLTSEDLESGIDYVDWCIGYNCTPSANNRMITANKSIQISDSILTQVCAVATNRAGVSSEVVCTNEIKKDTVKPEFSGIEDYVIPVTGVEISLTDGITVSDATSGVESETAFTYTPSSIDTNKTGINKIVYRAVDKAGNVNEVTRTIEINADAPTIIFTAQDGYLNEYDWAKEDFYVDINVTDNSGHGIKEFRVCTATTDTCDPTKGSVVTGKTTYSRLISTESNNNRICVIATDNSGKTSSIICSSAYKLDKTAPTVGSILVNGDNSIKNWYTEIVNIEAIEGSDDLSGHASTIVSTNKIDFNTIGEKVTVTTKDRAGHESTNDFLIKVDLSNVKNPTITSSDGIESGGWHTSSYTLTFKTSSETNSTSGITYYYGVTENDLSNKGNTVSINNNTLSTTYYVKACNGAGTCSDVVSYEAKLDNATISKPTITANDGIESGNWHTSSVTLTFNTPSETNSTSGITYYYGTSTSNMTSTGTSVSIIDNSKTNSGDTYYVKACNAANTCSDIASYVLKIDKSSMASPTITSSDGKTTNTWHTADFTLTFKTTSTPVSGITYYYGTSESNLTKTGSSVSISTNSATANGDTYYVKACNGAGTCSGVTSYVAKLDKVDPNVTITKSVVSNKNVLTAKLTENSISGYSYVWYKNGNVISGTTGSTYTTTEAGTYKVKVTTAAGLSKTSSDYTINSYTIIYNMNGATGSIASATKIQDLSITLSSTVPTRDGYEFLGWSTSQTATTETYKPGDTYTSNGSTTLYAVWKALYAGVPNITYKLGDTVTYQGIDFLVVKDNGDTVTLVTKSNVGTGAYGNSTTFSGSTASNYLNNTWVNNNTGIASEIAAGGIVKDSSTNSYVRLLTKSELSTSLPNGSGTNFWTSTANGSSIYYGLPDGSNSYTKYSVSSNSTGTCYSGSSTDLSAVSSTYNKNTLENSVVNASVAPSATSAVTSTSYALSDSGTCKASYSTSIKTVAEACNCTGTNCSGTYECTKTSTFNTTLTTSTQVLGSSCTGYSCTKYNTNYSTTKTSTISTPYTTSSWCTTSTTRTTNTNYYKTTQATSTAVYYSNKTTSTSYLKDYPITSTQYYGYNYIDGYSYYKTTSLTDIDYGVTTKTTSTKYYYTSSRTGVDTGYRTQATSTKYLTSLSRTGIWWGSTTKVTGTQYLTSLSRTGIWWGSTTKRTGTTYLKSTSYWCASGTLMGTKCHNATGVIGNARSAIKTTGTSYLSGVVTTTTWTYYTTLTTGTNYLSGVVTTTTWTYYTTLTTGSQVYSGAVPYTTWTYYTTYATDTDYYSTVSTNKTNYYYGTFTTSTKTYYDYSTTSTGYLYDTVTTGTKYYTTLTPTSSQTLYTTKTTDTSYDLTSGCGGSKTSTYYQAASTSYYSTPTTTTCAGSKCTGYTTSYNYLKTTKQTATPYQTTCGAQSSTCDKCDTCDVDYTVYTASGTDASWSRYVVNETTNPMGYRAVITVVKK